eukprot:4169879-Prymnesium_polylepis.1
MTREASIVCVYEASQAVRTPVTTSTRALTPVNAVKRLSHRTSGPMGTWTRARCGPEALPKPSRWP